MKWILNFHNFIIFKTGTTVVFQNNRAFNKHLLLNRIIDVFKQIIEELMVPEQLLTTPKQIIISGKHFLDEH